MKIKITDKKVLDALDTKQRYVNANTETLKEMERLEKEFQSNLAKAQRSDEKVRPLIKKLVDKIQFGEYEELSRVTKESGEWEIEIVDRMEEFKAAFAQRKDGNK